MNYWTALFGCWTDQCFLQIKRGIETTDLPAARSSFCRSQSGLMGTDHRFIEIKVSSLVPWGHVDIMHPAISSRGAQNLDRLDPKLLRMLHGLLSHHHRLDCKPGIGHLNLTTTASRFRGSAAQRYLARVIGLLQPHPMLWTHLYNSFFLVGETLGLHRNCPPKKRSGPKGRRWVRSE